MLYLVYGGSGSGKSAFAEKLLEELPGAQKYYIATMMAYDDDADAMEKIARHKRMRAGKGFKTIEQPVDIDKITLPAGIGTKIGPMESGKASALLECMSNLTANEMFSSEKNSDEIFNKIISGVKKLSLKYENLIIVSNNVFEDGIEYDQATRAYMELLSKINCELSNLADKVFEVVVGIPLVIK